MKFILPPAVLAGIISVASLPAADAQVTSGNVTLYGSWNITSGPMAAETCDGSYRFGDYQGGGFIDGNNLFLVGCSETEDATLFQIPLERDCKSNHFVGAIVPSKANWRIHFVPLPNIWRCTCSPSPFFLLLHHTSFLRICKILPETRSQMCCMIRRRRSTSPGQ